MTVLLALLEIQGVDDEGVRTLLSRTLTSQGGDFEILRPSPGVMLAAVSPRGGTREGSKVASGERYTVLADGTFYFLSELGAALSGAHVEVPAQHADAAKWVLATLERWGESGPERLEGDFAWIAWDAQRERLIAARDHAGTRPLFFARAGQGIAVSSLARTLRRVPGIDRALNLVTIAEDASDVGLVDARESPFTSIERIPAGHALRWNRRDGVQVSRWWDLPIFDQRGAESFDDAGEHLLQLIEQAVRERVDVARGTAVLLSGGYDSTSVYGAGQHALRRAGRGDDVLEAVSVSHPEGDPGREDELILQTTKQWGRDPHWVPIADVPAIEDPLRRARHRDEPFVHTYELWNRFLAERVRALPARVALNGLGGDFWFSLSPVFFADRLRRLQLRRFRNEWRQMMGRMTVYEVFKHAVRPNLPPWVVSLGRRLTGKPLMDLSHRRIPAWIRHDFVRRSGMEERRYLRIPRRRGESFAGAEQSWYLQSPFIERVSAHVDAFFAESGVEVRSPLMDARIIRYAATRSADESLATNWENKRLLRRALRGILPDTVTGPRTSRTGLPMSYFDRTVRAHLQQATADFAAGMHLADLGIIDPTLYLSLVDRFVEGEKLDPNDVVALSYAAHTEWWLRSDP